MGRRARKKQRRDGAPPRGVVEHAPWTGRLETGLAALGAEIRDCGRFDRETGFEGWDLMREDAGCSVRGGWHVIASSTRVGGGRRLHLPSRDQQQPDLPAVPD